ncbi:MAG: methylated-DNA--[protein]-cysteine S-methyltransferase [Deltaproteobacteria bacterium]|nr:methylated-DNA--[protein]-cysteine S-methyltransferase [Deltaproteobacteria bacterium]
MSQIGEKPEVEPEVKPGGLVSTGPKGLILETPLGPMEARAEAGALVYLGFGLSAGAWGLRQSQADLREEQPFKSLWLWLREYFAGKEPTIEVKMSFKGTDFQKLVWRELLKIPFGKVTSYGELSKVVFKALGRATGSGRAIGQAVGRNPLAILVPCHRVLAASGQLGGYASGLVNKKALLEIEGWRGENILKRK